MRRLLAIAFLIAACGGTTASGTPGAAAKPSPEAQTTSQTALPTPSLEPPSSPTATPTRSAELVIPSGIVSTQTADQAAQKMLDLIAANERKLGYALAAPRTIRIQLLRSGETYPLRRFDGTNPAGIAFSPSDGPGWVVEAVGTFLYFDRQSGELSAKGTHGFHLWDDSGAESAAFLWCWSKPPSDPAFSEGSCP